MTSTHKIGAIAAVGIPAIGLSVLAFGSPTLLRHKTRGNLTNLRSAAGEISIALAGDVMLARNVAVAVQGKREGFRSPFGDVADSTRTADVAFCNLESAISDRGQPDFDKRYTFRAPPQACDGLTFAGFDVVSLANNHILDYGPPVLEDTLSSLRGAGIAPVGVTTDNTPQTPVIIERNGLRIGFLAYADSHEEYAYAKEFLAFETRPAEAKKETLKRDIELLRKKADIIVVSFHWGVEYTQQPNNSQRDLGRFVIDRGAHIVAGHHPHVLQEPEWYQGGLIIYSMGNFVFDQHSRPATRFSRLYWVLVNNRGVVRAGYLPLEIAANEWQPTPLSKELLRVPG